MTALAVLAAMACVWLLVPGSGPGMGRLTPKTRRYRSPPDPWRIVAGVVGVTGVLGLMVGVMAVVAAAGMIAAAATWVVTRRLQAKRALQRTHAVVRVAQVFASLLALGHHPSTALALTAEECPVVAPVVAAERLGSNPWDVMAELARVPGQAGLAEIGRAWSVSHLTGASMRESLERVSRNLEQAADTAVIVAGELAGPRATGQLLALLPLAGLGIAYGIGADPWAFFSGGVMGRACLVVGVGLACAGVLWSERVASRAAGT